MKRELDEQLCRIAPHLFADRFAPMPKTCMCWGFDVGDGWYKLLKKAAKELEPLIVAAIKASPDSRDQGFYRATQIKEKFGTLRFYIYGGTKAMYAIIDKAEKQSSKICETCGKPGKLRGESWCYTRCLACWRREQKDA
jgi:hypothetical protein